MSIATTTREPEPSPDCGDGMVYDAELGECVPKADSDVVGGGAASGAEKSVKGMLGAVKSIFEDLVDMKIQEMEQRFNKQMDATLITLQKQFAVGLRRELGLSDDPSVTKSQLDASIRKAVLDLKVGGKRTPAGTPIDAPLQKAAPKPGDVFAQYGRT